MISRATSPRRRPPPASFRYGSPIPVCLLWVVCRAVQRSEGQLKAINHWKDGTAGRYHSPSLAALAREESRFDCALRIASDLMRVVYPPGIVDRTSRMALCIFCERTRERGKMGLACSGPWVVFFTPGSVIASLRHGLVARVFLLSPGPK
jgi:hypothetical protein